MRLFQTTKPMNLIPPAVTTPFPKNARMFFCIGAQKAGTTWLYDYLAAHPQCHFSPNKELHYFDVRAGKANLAYKLRFDILQDLTAKLSDTPSAGNRATLEQLIKAARLLEIYSGSGEGANRHDPYLKYLLTGRKRQPLVGDITPSYAILDRESFADMGSIGEAKFIFIMRDPIARMWSQTRMALAQQPGMENQSAFEAACNARIETLVAARRLRRIERSNYRQTIEELEAAIPARRIKYVFYERLFEPETANDICDFLGISHRPVEASKVVNEGMRAAMSPNTLRAMRRAFAPQYEFVRARFGDNVPDAWSRHESVSDST